MSDPGGCTLCAGPRLSPPVLSSRWSSDAGQGPTTSDVVVDDDAHGLYLVARGLGPEPDRTQAVQAAAAAAVTLVLRSIALDPRAPLDVLARLAVEDANSVTWRRRAHMSPDVRVVLTLLLVRNGQVAVGHVGHARLLRIAGGQPIPLTVEHTVLGEHQRLGYPRPVGPPRLTRSLGESMFVDVDVSVHPLELGASYVLLSSGFERVDASDELTPVVCGFEPARVPAKLIELARERGEHERLSALVVEPASLEAQPSEAPLGPPSRSRPDRVPPQRGVIRGLP